MSVCLNLWSSKTLDSTVQQPTNMTVTSKNKLTHTSCQSDISVLFEL